MICVEIYLEENRLFLVVLHCNTQHCTSFRLFLDKYELENSHDILEPAAGGKGTDCVSGYAASLISWAFGIGSAVQPLGAIPAARVARNQPLKTGTNAVQPTVNPSREAKSTSVKIS